MGSVDPVLQENHLVELDLYSACVTVKFKLTN